MSINGKRSVRMTSLLYAGMSRLLKCKQMLLPFFHVVLGNIRNLDEDNFSGRILSLTGLFGSVSRKNMRTRQNSSRKHAYIILTPLNPTFT